jgi:hypothetical protein
MQNNGVDLLVEKWLGEAGFREKLANDPEGTVHAAGITLNAEEWATLRNVVMSSSDEALQTRISKGQGWN